MRVAFIVNNYPPRTGGVEFHVASLAAALQDQGHSVLVITLGESPGWRDADGVEILTLREHHRVADTLGLPPLRARRTLTTVLRSRKIDIVSVHTRFFPMTTIGLRAARAARIPTIHTEHGSGHVVSDSRLIRVASRAVDATLGRWALRHADYVLAVSEAVVDFVQRLAGVEAEVFYNAIDSPLSSREQISQDTNRMVFVGRLVQGKGWDTYLRALSALHASGIDVVGDVVGDGPDADRVHEAILHEDLGEAVTVHGRVSQSQVRRLLCGATLVNPTVLAEGFQTTLLEAVAEQARVITYPVPGAHELSAQGAPVIITEEKTLNALIEAMRAAVGRPWVGASPTLVQNWTWPVRAREYATIVEGIMRFKSG